MIEEYNEDDFLDNLPKKVRGVFGKYNNIEDYTDANEILYKLFFTKENLAKINEKNFKSFLYPTKWQKLSTGERACAMLRSYSFLCKKLGVKKHYKLIFVNDESRIDSNAEFCKQGNYVWLGLDNILSNQKNEKYLGLICYSLLAHEVNHILQEQSKTKIIENGNYDNLTLFEKSLFTFPTLNIFFGKLNNNSKMYEELSKKVSNIADTKKWEEFFEQVYFSHPTEIDSGNVQTNFLEDLSNELYAQNGKSYLTDKPLVKLIESTKNLYNEENGKKIFFNESQFATELDELTCLLQGEEARLIKEKCKIDRKIKNETEKSKLAVLKANNEILLNQLAHTSDLKLNCLTSFVDFFVTRKIPEYFDKSLFKIIPKLIEFQNKKPTNKIEM